MKLDHFKNSVDFTGLTLIWFSVEQATDFDSLYHYRKGATVLEFVKVYNTGCHAM